MNRWSSLTEQLIRTKRVLYRAAYDVPLVRRAGRMRVADDSRLLATLPTLRFLVRHRARIVIASFLGRPKGRPVADLRLKPVAARLAKLLQHRVESIDVSVGPQALRAAGRLRPGEILVLENTRFHPGEDANQAGYARQLAALGDIYVTDAFAQMHRPVASIVGVPRYLPTAAGLLLQKELTVLERVMKQPKRPLVAIIGGAKISTKLGLVRRLLDQVDYIMLGGALANTLLKAKGMHIGRSLVEPNMVRTVRSLDLSDPRLKIPVDVLVGRAIHSRARPVRRAVGTVGEREVILDCGPDTIGLYLNVIAKAGTIIWNGPLGYFEIPPFRKSTEAIAKAIARSSAFSVAGGGETIEAIHQAGLTSQFGFISTGGGAMLEFIEGKKLPGLQAIGYYR